jgi:hypothetical protein
MFVDMAKAYDSVDRGRMWQVFLSDLGLSPDLVCSLQRLYTDLWMEVHGNGPSTSPIAIRVGAKQGCPCSPGLFATFFDRVFWAIQDELTRDGRGGSSQLVSLLSTQLMILFFADDVALLARSAEGLRRIFGFFVGFCTRENLTVN